jgi:predicted DsbA family dithiol-disulfide isomerase
MLRRMDPKQVQAAQTRLKRAGAEMGLSVKLGGYIGSSRLAHRLLFMAEKEKGPGKQCEVAELLFHHQFEREADTSKLDVVIAAGVQAGFHEDEVRDWLEESNAGRLETEKEAKEVRAAGVTGVPHFVIGETRHLDGVVDLSEFFQAFIEARQRQEDGLRLDALS